MTAAGRSKHQPLKISAILRHLVPTLEKKSRSMQETLEVLWLQAVGENIAQHTSPGKMVAQKLLIHVENSVWMNELTYLKEQIKINAKKVFRDHAIPVEEIVFKIGKIKSSPEVAPHVPPSGK